MRSILFLAVASVLLITTIGGFLLFSYMSEAEPVTTEIASDPFGAKDPFGSTVIPAKPSGTGSQVTESKATKDIYAKAASSLKSETGIDGVYYRLLPPEGDDLYSPYVIIISPAKQYVQMTIYGTPVGRYRKEAEKFLLNYFGISEADACTTPYLVVPSDDTNSEYAGTNVGLSFCPGSVRLSEI